MPISVSRGPFRSVAGGYITRKYIRGSSSHEYGWYQSFDPTLIHPKASLTVTRLKFRVIDPLE